MATQQEYDDILLYKTAASNAGQKKYRDGLSTNDKRSVRDKAQRYALQQQCLYLPEKDSTGMQRMRRIVVKQEEKNRILKMCHGGVELYIELSSWQQCHEYGQFSSNRLHLERRP